MAKTVFWGVPVNSHPLLRMRQVPTFYDLSFPSYGGSKGQRSKFSTFFKRAKNLFLDLFLGVEFISDVKKMQKFIFFEIRLKTKILATHKLYLDVSQIILAFAIF